MRKQKKIETEQQAKEYLEHVVLKWGSFGKQHKPIIKAIKILLKKEY